jgi:hypothetical protein
MDMPGKLEGVDELYEVYYRFLETDDDYFDSHNAPWRIYGISLPEQILRKVYYQNAVRVFGLES